MSVFGEAAAVSPVAIGIYNPVIRDIPRKDAELSLRFWLEELANGVNMTYKPIRFYDDLDEMKRDVLSGELNFIIATSMDVVQHFSSDDLRDGFSAHKVAADDLYLVVRRGAHVQKLADLAGKRFALLEDDELSEIYLRTLMLRTWGKADEGRLAGVEREKRSNKLVLRLFFNQADAALINRNSYEAAVALNPQIEQRLQVLDAYTFKGRSPVVGLFSTLVSPEDRAAITRAAMSINTTVRGRQLLDVYRADSMLVSKASDLEPYRSLLAEYLERKGAAGGMAKRVRP